MDDNNQDSASASPQGIPGVNILSCVRTQLAKDGKSCMVVFKISENDGMEFAMVFPVAALGMLLSMVQDLRDDAGIKNLDTGMVRLREPSNFAVGNSPTRRGFVFLTFDEKKSDEATYAIRDEDALNLAAMIERDALSRMTMAERRNAMRKASPVLLPGLGGGKLILPE